MNIRCSKCNVELTEIDSLYALTRVIKEGDKINFNPASGIPVKVYVCQKCGKLEIYSAKVIGAW